MIGSGARLIMKINEKNPPRIFEVGFDKKGFIKDCGNISLLKDEQITFTTENGAEYDVTRKSWGFYATPSTNGRLKSFGLRTVLVKNRINKYFILLVESGHEKDFEIYAKEEPLSIIFWLDEGLELDGLTLALDK